MMDGAGDGCEEETTEELQVEVEGEDGSKFTFENGDKAVFGRGSGFNTDDRTVSRRHVSFQLESEIPRVSFQVIGRNPIWVYTNINGEEALKLFRKFEKGHLEFGDRFCLSPKKPLWFSLKKGTHRIDVSGIDPVKEFGFVEMGHEFDHYPKGMIRNVKDWEWFLEEPSKDSDDDDSGRERRRMRRKRKKHKDDEDEDEDEDEEEWTGESEDDQNLVAGMQKGKTPKYSTRSKDKNKGPNRDTKAGSNSKAKKAANVDESDEEEEDDDDDETLEGFIVSDEEDDPEDNNEDEEEEFEEEDDDDELED